MYAIISKPNTVDFATGEYSIATLLYYIVNSIIYQRAVYPTYNFTRVVKYGLPLMVNVCPKHYGFLQRVFTVVQDLSNRDAIMKVALVICSIPSGKAVERWEFSLSPMADQDHVNVSDEQLRHIFQSVSSIASFMQPLPKLCEIDIEITLSSGQKTPDGWEPLEPNLPAVHTDHVLSSFHSRSAEVQLCLIKMV